MELTQTEKLALIEHYWPFSSGSPAAKKRLQQLAKSAGFTDPAATLAAVELMRQKRKTALNALAKK